MFADRLQAQRFELKFHLRPATAAAVRVFVGGYLELDEYSAGRPDAAYPVHSLYLDSEDMQLCQATLCGHRNRFKLRVRYYNDAPDQPVFFEIKRRQNDCIFKQRAAVRRECAEALLAGKWPEPCHLFSAEAQQLLALQAFHGHLTDLRARPRAHIAYQREAWTNPANSVRITFDRDVLCEPAESGAPHTRLRQPVAVFTDEVILEVKFTDRFPAWIGEMVQGFGLERRSAAKYVEGVTRAGARDGDLTAAELGRAFAGS